MELELYKLEFHANFFFYLFFFLKFDHPIPIAAFNEPYNGVLNGTRAPWTRVLCKYFIYLFIFFNLSLIIPYSIFYKLSFTLKLNFEIIEFQNKSISLISLKNGVKRWFFCTKRAFVHFGQEILLLLISILLCLFSSF